MNVRPPAEIYMTDEWSCVSCVTAQVLYMFGIEQPPFNLADIDRRIGRQPNQPYMGKGDYLELLRHGLTLTTIQDSNIEALLSPHGYEYLLQYLAQKDPEILSMYTPDFFYEWQGVYADFWQQVPNLPGKLEVIAREPRSKDILDLLRSGCSAVILQFNEDATSSHVVMAYEVDERGLVTIYSPEFPEDQNWILQRMTLQEIDAQLIAYEGIVGVSL